MTASRGTELEVRSKLSKYGFRHGWYRAETSAFRERAPEPFQSRGAGWHWQRQWLTGCLGPNTRWQERDTLFTIVSLGSRTGLGIYLKIVTAIWQQVLIGFCSSAFSHCWELRRVTGLDYSLWTRSKSIVMTVRLQHSIDWTARGWEKVRERP